MRLKAFVAVMALVALTACTTGPTPRTTVHNARAIYTTSVEVMADLAAGGLIDLEVAEQFESVRGHAAALLEEAEAAVVSGAEFNFADLDSTLAALTQIVALARRAVTP